MGDEKSASIIITVTEKQKHALKKIAAQHNLADLYNTETISSLGRQAIEEFLFRSSQENIK